MPRLRPILALMTLLALLFSMAPSAMAADPIRVEDLTAVSVFVDDQQLHADAYIVDGRTVAPLRAIFERLSATVEWNGDTRTVTATKGSTVIKLTIDKTEAYIGDQTVTLAVPAMIINGSTFVPVRFVSEALGIPTQNISFNSETKRVDIRTGSGCSIPGGQVHEGKIQAQGETWGICGSPHIVKGPFKVEGPDSPILTIEAGVLVQFEAGASLEVGEGGPGGLLINGTASNPTTLTAAAAGAMPGSWNGMRFYNQTLRDQAVIQGARIQYAGASGNQNGAIYVDAQDKPVEIKIVDTTISDSLFAGLNLWGMSRLSASSKNLTITGTKMADGEGGFPIVTHVSGTNNLPDGKYTGNDLDAVHIWDNTYSENISSNTTWRNIGIPYASSEVVKVQGNASPTLTIEPGVISLWKQGTYLTIGEDGPGTLVADAKAKPEGNGDWKTALDTGLQLATSNSMMPSPPCGLCGSNKTIVFGAWSDSATRGSWDGILFKGKAGDKSKLNGVVVAYAGTDSQGAIYAEGDGGTPVRYLLANSLVTGSNGVGVQFYGDNASFMPGSTGNVFKGNAVAVRLFPEGVGTLETGNTISGNDNDWVSIWTNGSEGKVSKNATWRNVGVPYFVETTISVKGSARPVLTLEPGTKFVFADGYGISVGEDAVGSLVAVGTAEKPILFTSEVGRAGTWTGLSFGEKAGAGNKLEYVTIEDANIGVELSVDLGPFLKNSTIRSSAEQGIYRWFDRSTGTSYTKGLGNQFEGNAEDQNEE